MTNVVKVGVEMETGDLRAEAKQVARAIDGVGNAVESTGDNLKDFSKDGEKAEAAVRDLGNEVDKSESKLQKIGRRLKQSSASMANFGGAMRSSWNVAKWGSDKVVNQYSAMAGGAGMGLMIKKSMDFNAQLRQIGINAMDMQGKIGGKSFTEGMAELKKEVLGVSKAMGQSPDELLTGIGEVVRFSGDLKLAREQLQLAADVTAASGAGSGQVLTLIDTLNKMGNVKSQDMRSVLNMIVMQGKSGAFDIGEFAAQAPQMLGVLSQFAGGSGKVDSRALNSFVALTNLGMSATHNAEMTRTGILALANDVSDVNVLKQRAKSAGVSDGQLNSALYSDSKHTQRRSIEEFLRRIVVTTGGSTEKMSVLFGEASQKIALALAASWRENDKKFSYLDQQLKTAEQSSQYDAIGEGKRINMQDPKVQANIALQTVLGKAREFSEMIINLVAPAVKFLNENVKLFQGAIYGISAALAVAVGVVVGGKIKTFIKEGLGAWGIGKKGGRGGLGASFPGMPEGATPVYVVNAGWGGIGGAGSSLPTGGESVPTGSGRRGGRVSRLASRSGVVFGGMFAVDALMEEGNTAMGWGRAAGAILGAEAGAKLGAFGGPLGMAIGGAIGGFLGSTVLPWVRDNVSEYQSRKEAEQWADRTGKVDRSKAFASDATAASTAVRSGKVASSFFSEAKVVAAPAGAAAGFSPIFNIDVSLDRDGRPTTSVEGPGAQNSRVNAGLGPKWGLAN